MWTVTHSGSCPAFSPDVERTYRLLRAGGHGLFGVVEDQAQRVSIPCPYLADTVAHCDTIHTSCANNRALVDGENDRLALLQRHHRGAGLPARAGRRTPMINRSMRLTQFAPLAEAQATFLALQKGPAEAEAATATAGMKVMCLANEIRDFEDTAAILTVADLLISVDSSPVHLAGALGRPVWVMLPFIPDWRWLMNRHDTPWYPSMRLFRQARRGDWEDVIQAVA